MATKVVHQARFRVTSFGHPQSFAKKVLPALAWSCRLGALDSDSHSHSGTVRASVARWPRLVCAGVQFLLHDVSFVAPCEVSVWLLVDSVIHVIEWQCSRSFATPLGASQTRGRRSAFGSELDSSTHGPARRPTGRLQKPRRTPADKSMLCIYIYIYIHIDTHSVIYLCNIYIYIYIYICI